MLKSGSPLIQAVIEDARHEAYRRAVVLILVARFGVMDAALRYEIEMLDVRRLTRFIRFAATCPDLDAFRGKLATRRLKRRT